MPRHWLEVRTILNISAATETIGLLVYNEAFDYFRIGTASAAGVLMLALAIGIILLALKPLKKEYF